MLTRNELLKLQSVLTQQLTSLRQQIGDELTSEANERYRDIAGEVTDAGDEAIGAEIAGTDNALIGHEVDEVRDIEGALARIADGTYGRCRDCGRDVEYDRLAAYPAATRCAPCQAVHEKTFAGGQHPSL